jgi:hypothetical protein
MFRFSVFSISDDRIELGRHGRGGGCCRYVCMSDMDVDTKMDWWCLGTKWRECTRNNKGWIKSRNQKLLYFFALSFHGAAVKVKRWAVHVVRIRAMCFNFFSLLYHYRNTQHIRMRIGTTNINVYLKDTGLPVCSAVWQGWGLQTCQLATEQCYGYLEFCNCWLFKFNPFRSYIEPLPTVWFLQFCSDVGRRLTRVLLHLFARCRSLSDAFPYVVRTLANK